MRATLTFIERFETKGGVAFEPGDEVVGVKRASFGYPYGDSLLGFWSCYSPHLGWSVAVPCNRSELFVLKEARLRQPSR